MLMAFALLGPVTPAISEGLSTMGDIQIHPPMSHTPCTKTDWTKQLTNDEATASAEPRGTVRFDRWEGKTSLLVCTSGLSILTVVGRHSPSYNAVHCRVEVSNLRRIGARSLQLGTYEHGGSSEFVVAKVYGV